MKKILILALVFASFCCFAQKQGNIWYFGYSAGLDFNNGTPVALLNGQIGNGNNFCNGFVEGSSAICDSAGSLLFYCDGHTIWNKNHQKMPHGDSLMGSPSSTQSSIIVPQPLSDRYFYVFTTDAFHCGDLSNGFRYSVVDICADNQLGDVIPDQKNIFLADTVAEKLAVTRHANGIDYWILTHKFHSDKFYAFQLSTNGIINTVVTSIGSFHPANINTAMGQLKFSSNGQKIAIGACNGFDLLELFDFDNTTGIISNCKSLYKPNNNSAGCYGVEFSPDNTKLYAQGLTDLGLMWAFLIQYDLSAGGGTLGAINASMNYLYKDTLGLAGLVGLQLAPDNKIYLVSINDQYTLSVIQNPNLYGVGCNYQDQYFSLAGRKGSYSLPSFIAGYDFSSTLPNCSVEGIKESEAKEEITLFPNPTPGTFQITSPSAITHLKVFDIMGKLLYEKKPGSNDVSLNLNLPDGVYFVHILCKEGAVVKKVMVQK